MRSQPPFDGRALTAQETELVRKLDTLVKASFTGTLQVEWKDGVPQLIRTTQTERIGGRHTTLRIDRKHDRT